MKAYKPNITNSSLALRYALMSLAAETVCSSVVLGHLSDNVSPDRLTMLIVLYNIIAVMGRGIVSVFADKVSGKHTGVRLGVLLIVLGYYFPVKFGIDIKVVVLALGSCVFHSFAASSLLSRSGGKSKDIGLFLAGSALGIALTTFADFFGHIMAAFLMMLAVPPDRYEEICNENANIEAEKAITCKPFIFVPLLMIAYTAVFYLISSFDFSWNTWFKTEFSIFLALALGRAFGGIVCDFVGRIMTVTAGVSGGVLLLFFCQDNKTISLLGLFLISAAIAPIVTTAYRHMPRYPGFVFALLSSSAYLGQILTVYLPLKSYAMFIICALVLAVFSSAELMLIMQTEPIKEEDTDA